MKKNSKVTEFFMGSESSEGFVSLFNSELYDAQSDWFCFIIKGAAGTGKSGLMRRVAEFAQKKHLDTEIIYCSSDPDSLDGVIIPERKICVVDGTAPHVQDPIFPGVSDCIINFGEFWDEKILKENADSVKKLCNKISKYHMNGQSFMFAFGIIENTNLKIMKKHFDVESAVNFSKKLFNNYFGDKVEDKKTTCHEKKRFITGVTSKGKVFLDNTLENLCETIVQFDDKYGFVSNIILQTLRSEAINSGLDVISCICPIFPNKKLDGIIIPSEEIAFIVGDNYHKISGYKNIKKYNTTKFIDKTNIDLHKNLLKFNKKIQDSFINEAIKNFSKAKSLHDELEKIYISAMNFEKIDVFFKKIVKNI